MQWFYNFKIGTKLILGFILVSIITAVVGFMGIYNMGKISDMTDTMFNRELMAVSYIKEANINLIYAGRAEKNAIIAPTMEERLKHLSKVKEYEKAFLEYFEKSKPMFITEQGKEGVRKLEKAWDDYTEVKEKLAAMIEKDDLISKTKTIEIALGIGREKANVVDDMLTDLTKSKESLAQQYAVEAQDVYKSSRLFMLMLILGSVASGIFIGIFISRTITKPAIACVDFAKKLAAGDLTDRVSVEQKDEMGLLAESLNQATGDLAALISNVIVSAQNLAQAVEQISSGNQNLSQRTSEQASALEEVASTIEEATAAINQNYENSAQANKLADNSSVMAVNGGQLVKEAVDSINEINQTSKQISEIITVINDISFQTNLLALNAAVEAARAGEQGRGFAVVAGEVRNLAQRSGNAAKEIGGLIKASVEKIEDGTEKANKSGTALQEIIESVKNVSRMISEIAASSSEQKQGINQINTAISEMDSMTQQNASLVEETASASEEMANQAQELLGMVQKFKVNQNVESEVYQRKHHEIHLKAAGGKTVKKTATATTPVAPPKEKMKQMLEKEGFEEF